MATESTGAIEYHLLIELSLRSCASSSSRILLLKLIIRNTVISVTIVNWQLLSSFIILSLKVLIVVLSSRALLGLENVGDRIVLEKGKSTLGMFDLSLEKRVAHMRNRARWQIYAIFHSLRVTQELVWFWDEISWRRRSIIVLYDSCLSNGWVIIASLRWIHSILCPYAWVYKGWLTRTCLYTVLLDLAQCHELTLIYLDKVICSSLLNLRCYHGIIPGITFLLIIDWQTWVFAWLVKATSFEASPRQFLNQLIVLVAQTVSQLALMITAILVRFTTLTSLFWPRC